MSSEKILVGGAGGFIGGHLVKALISRGHQVRAVDYKPLEMWYQPHAQAENIVANLSASDKSRLAKKLAKDLTGEIGGIEKTPNVMGGVACIRQTRIPVWMLENARRQGVSEAELLLNYPGLTAKDLANAWDYVNLRLDEIEIEIAENEAED